jgi:predicted DNA-binding transcriptional regulator AlpA
MIKAGQFPKSFKISPGAVGWDFHEIQEWIEARRASRD